MESKEPDDRPVVIVAGFQDSKNAAIKNALEARVAGHDIQTLSSNGPEAIVERIDAIESDIRALILRAGSGFSLGAETFNALRGGSAIPRSVWKRLNPSEPGSLRPLRVLLADERITKPDKIITGLYFKEVDFMLDIASDADAELVLKALGCLMNEMPRHAATFLKLLQRGIFSVNPREEITDFNVQKGRTENGAASYLVLRDLTRQAAAVHLAKAMDENDKHMLSSLLNSSGLQSTVRHAREILS